MGMLASYMMIDESTLNSIMDLNNNTLASRLNDIEEEERFEKYDIGKIWDALHCFLTGVSASHPIDGDKLSEAIVGIHKFHHDDDADFIGCIENNELNAIINALELLDLDNTKSQFSRKQLMAKRVYPNGIWEDSKEQLLGEFEHSFKGLLQFYRKALEGKFHVIVSIL